MNFNLTSPELLDMESYQRTLKGLILVLASLQGRSGAEQRAKGEVVEVAVGAGGTFVVNMSLVEPSSEDSSSLEEPGQGLAESNRVLMTQSYPLSFIASGQLPGLRAGMSSMPSSAPLLHYIRLPLNPLQHPIQCQLSARRLHARHVMLLDRVLRRLCDSSPGAFMVGYSDGLSGVDAGTEVVYSGENGPQHQHQHHHPHSQESLHQHHQPSHHHQQQHFTTRLDKAVEQARDRGDPDVDHRVAGLVGHVAHAQKEVDPLMDVSKESGKKNVKGLQELKDTLRAAATAIVTGEMGQDASSLGLGLDEGGILSYDYGQLDDVDQLVDYMGHLDIDDLHDFLWV